MASFQRRQLRQIKSYLSGIGNLHGMCDKYLLEKYGGPVPRYTSYPTALQFNDTVNGNLVTSWLPHIRGSASVYLHMAYCKSLCLYCGCNMKVTNRKETISAYVTSVLKEIEMVTSLLPEKTDVTTVHFGGGTPSYTPPEDLMRLLESVSSNFNITSHAEISMEIDPRQLPEGLPSMLGKMGFNRASLGIQDTNPEVQQAINRIQPNALNLGAVSKLRAAGIQNINIDLIYGLPRQTVKTIRQTVADAMELAPQRVSLFGYAHVPWMKKHQKVLEQYGLPSQQERMEMFEAAAGALIEKGYMQIGFDHFCLPEDPMAKALKTSTLHRNFMGYTTDDAELLFGFGASAISQFPQGYAQNISSPGSYMAELEKDLLPVTRGVETTKEDGIRRQAIESLLCHMQLSKKQVDALILDRPRLMDMIQDGMAEWQDNKLCMTEKGRPYVRSLASCFDAYQSAQSKHTRI